MRRINFTKMAASGNDFIITETRDQRPETRNPKLLAKQICDRKFGVGADGLLILDKSKIADVKMRIFNPDGSEPAMCGNGARCIAVYSARNQKPCLSGRQAETSPSTSLRTGTEPFDSLRSLRANAEPVEAEQGRSARNQLKIETKAGIIEAEVKGDNVKIKLTDPKDIKLDIPIKINNRPLKVNFIDTGVPHTVVFVSGLDKIDVVGIGRIIRHHKRFLPQGTNINFVELIDEDNIYLRTYERGVEDETLACGTGAVAAAIILSTLYSLLSTHKINVHTKSGEILKVYFKRRDNRFTDVCLEGKAKIVYKGVYYV